MNRNRCRVLVLTAATAGLGGWALGQSVEKSTNWVSPSGTRLRVLVDKGTLGGAEAELGEITFAANTDSGEHAHGSTEIFYVLEGELGTSSTEKASCSSRGWSDTCGRRTACSTRWVPAGPGRW